MNLICGILRLQDFLALFGVEQRYLWCQSKLACDLNRNITRPVHPVVSACLSACSD